MSKNILIVGGSSGLGKELALLYASDGCTIGIVGRRENNLTEIQEQYPSAIHVLKADINDPAIDTELLTLIDAMNGIDILVVTASTIDLDSNLNFETQLKTIATNVDAYSKVINLAWHYFVRKGRGQIVGVTSIAAARGNKNAPAYHASKAFQSTYLESLRIKAKKEKNNIIVTELIPGYINTEMGKGDRLFWMITTKKAANLSKQAIDKKKARAFIPKKWWLIYHVQRLLPDFIYVFVVNGSWKLKSKY